MQAQVTSGSGNCLHEKREVSSLQVTELRELTFELKKKQKVRDKEVDLI